MFVEEIIINETSNGFIFRIENYDGKESQLFTSTQRLSLIGGIGQGKRNSITSIKEIEKRKDFPQIGKNYVPTNYDEINFDINDKIFLFQDKTLQGKKIEQIGDYFNDRFYQPEIKLSEKNEENNEEEEENEDDDEDYESESSEFGNNEDEKKKEIEKETLKMNIRKSLFYDDTNDYYKVKLSNIKL